ncbi:hypothetical protein E9232_004876 [Inquilinus ginsengisoli]|uniref:Uncharacterized protein n=1 Tax=Inquilinus ginsengisoli TaxID=363840 RepID=A0ABU1JUN8_9PROT|nr:hypothetical protein [Inquilinus ginsengisoli]MDR6292336.1 hypothetical protein [Inquilinus ginsengisoli]
MQHTIGLLKEIDAFLAATCMKETTFGRKVVNDGKFVPRLRAGGDVGTRVAARVREFIHSTPCEEISS